MKHYDVAIIGAGTAGLSARREVEKKTDNYIVIDGGTLGTTCARVGCMPSKVLIEVANNFHQRHKLEEMGILGAENLKIDHKLAMKHVRKLRDRFVRGVMGGMESWTSDKLISKYATFIDSNTLDLEGEKIKADNIIIATGSTPIVPNTWREYKDFFISTDEFFELEELPKKVAVIGLGVIGVELGQALSRMGIEVVGLTIGKSIGGTTDPDIQNYIGDKLKEEFPISFEGADLVGTEDGKLLIKSGSEVHKVDKAFLTVGRRPNVDKLGFENLNIEKDERGLPVFSETTYQIPGTNLYFAGDANAKRPLLHEAADEGRIAGYNAVHKVKQCFQRREFMAVTFSDPNIAVIGRSFKELTDTGASFVSGEVSYEGFGRAIVKLKEKGLLHLYGDKYTGKLLGAEMFAPDGEHLANSLTWIISLGLTAREALTLPFYHPVMEESLRTALRDLVSKTENGPGELEVLRCEEPPVGIRS